MALVNGNGLNKHIRVTLLNMGWSYVLVDPLTGVPVGLLTMLTVGAIDKQYNVITLLEFLKCMAHAKTRESGGIHPEIFKTCTL